MTAALPGTEDYFGAARAAKIRLATAAIRRVRRSRASVDVRPRLESAHRAQGIDGMTRG
jgi:hypothetical protein